MCSNSNIGKRDILIFPKFKNMGIIDDIRNRYDRLAYLVAPHLTLAFPFQDSMSDTKTVFLTEKLLTFCSNF